MTSIATVASGQPYADIAAVRVGVATLVASLSSTAPGRQRHTKSSTPGATVAVRLIDDKATSLSGWNTVTTRALAAGGLAMAAGSRPEDGAAVAWTARDDGNAQVHLNHVDRRGRRTNEIQLTTTKGGASDVALAWVGDGWLVAWVDMRDGNGEVYASKVDRDLHRVAREERITHSPGDAGDVVLAVRGDTAWLAWSDPRESPRDGLGDIYVTTLNTHNARRSGDEVRVLATAAHSRSPFLTASGDGAFLAWIEEGPTGLDAPGAAMVARVDRKGHLLGNPSSLPLSGLGRPTALAVAASGDGARAIVARSAGDEITLDAVTLDADGIPGREAWPMVDLEAPTSFDVAVALTGDVLFYNDTGATPEGRRVRRAAMAWRP